METHKYLRDRDGWWHYKRRVPKHARPFDKRPYVKASMQTQDLKLALAKRDHLNDELEKIWNGLVESAGDNPSIDYQSAVNKCQALGLQYKTNDQLLAGDISELVGRLEIVEKHYQAAPIARAVLGTVSRPEIKLDQAWEIYLRVKKGKLLDRSDNFIRKWKNPRLKAIKNFKMVIGDLPIEEINVITALSFRDWWFDRMENQGLTANSANKDMGHLWQVLKHTAQAERLALPNPFAGLNIEEDKASRPPLPTENILKIINFNNLDKLNPGAREILFGIAECGCRISELAGLEKIDIILDHEIPHLDIRPNKTRQLKNKPSARKIPLIGYALELAKSTKFKNLKKYGETPDNASGCINKFLRENDLLPTIDHSLYSMRHSFKDRLVAVDAPPRIVDDLMGHSSGNVKYGTGTSLEHKLIWLEKISLK